AVAALRGGRLVLVGAATLALTGWVWLVRNRDPTRRNRLGRTAAEHRPRDRRNHQANSQPDPNHAPHPEFGPRPSYLSLAPRRKSRRTSLDHQTDSGDVPIPPCRASARPTVEGHRRSA